VRLVFRNYRKQPLLWMDVRFLQPTLVVFLSFVIHNSSYASLFRFCWNICRVVPEKRRRPHRWVFFENSRHGIRNVQCSFSDGTHHLFNIFVPRHDERIVCCCTGVWLSSNLLQILLWWTMESMSQSSTNRRNLIFPNALFPRSRNSVSGVILIYASSCTNSQFNQFCCVTFLDISVVG
jgi:hypothetical protein